MHPANAFSYTRISIVSADFMSTVIFSIKGILTTDDYQIIFMDTPGVNKTHTRLSKLMDKSINESISGTDVVIAMVDLTRQRTQTDGDEGR